MSQTDGMLCVEYLIIVHCQCFKHWLDPYFVYCV